jgi:membrane protease YdiL (CAAX protease family)
MSIEFGLAALLLSLVVSYFLYREISRYLIAPKNLSSSTDQLRHNQFKPIFFYAAALICAVLPLLLAILLSDVDPKFEGLSALIFSPINIVAFLSFCLLIPIFEEILFRAVVIPLLLRKFPILTVLLIQSLTFLAHHFGDGFERGVGFYIFIFILAFVTGLFYVLSGSLRYAIICHVSWNFSAFIIHEILLENNLPGSIPSPNPDTTFLLLMSALFTYVLVGGYLYWRYSKNKNADEEAAKMPTGANNVEL